MTKLSLLPKIDWSVVANISLIIKDKRLKVRRLLSVANSFNFRGQFATGMVPSISRNRHNVDWFFYIYVLYFGWPNQPSSGTMRILHWDVILLIPIEKIFSNRDSIRNAREAFLTQRKNNWSRWSEHPRRNLIVTFYHVISLFFSPYTYL